MSIFFHLENSYFIKRSPKIGRNLEQYDNAGMVMDEDMEKKDYVAMTSHRIDPHSVPPTHRRSRAASYTPGKGTFNNDFTLSEEVLNRGPFLRSF
jgi:hypothetical protein